MLINYIKATLNSMWRRKWFSLLTMFSIALSLVVVTCGASLWNMISAPIAPEVNKDRTFFLSAKVRLKKNGKEIHPMNAVHVFMPEFIFKKSYQLKTPQMVTVFESRGGMSYYVNGREKYFFTMQTDHNFFKVFDFEFINGKPYAEKDNRLTIPLCVISKEYAQHYFKTNDCIGSVVNYRNNKYRVSGVFNKPVTTSITSSDFYYLINPDKASKMWNWRDIAFLCDDKNDKAALDAELKHIGQISSAKHEHQEADLYTVASVEKRLENFVDEEYYPIFFALLFIILILPILCLIDVLRNFIAEKREELAIRKAFGANKKSVIIQLMFENLLLTILGGLFGLILSFLIFGLLSNYNVYKLFFIFFSFRAFAWYFFVFLIIGSIAGLLPAYGLSRQAIVNALNNQES